MTSRRWRLGWLPTGQITSVAISTGCFAVLARTLGPEPFSQFALLIFVYTITSLAVDLSPAGYLLTHSWQNPKTVRATKTVAVASGAVGALVLVPTVAIIASSLSFDDAWVTAAILGLSLVIQSLTQVPRAILIRLQKYRRVAEGEIVATLLAAIIAIAISIAIHSTIALVLQLLTLSLIRCLWMSVVEGYAKMPQLQAGSPAIPAIITYGFRVLPLNVAAYLSRSLDSGILPLLIPSVDAATYARSYQVVISPVSQAQVSLGGVVLAHLSDAGIGEARTKASARVWSVLLYGSGVASVAIAAGSSLIAIVLFGSKWPDAPVFITAMACAIIPLATALYSSWQLQLEARYGRSIAQLGAALVSPASVLASASMFGTVGAIVALVVSSALVPHVYIAMHGSTPGGRIRRHGQAATISAILTAIFFVIATSNQFWSRA